MRILLFGPNGQIGREILRRAAGSGDEVVACPREACDLTRAESVSSTLKDAACDAVINAAAYTSVDKAETDAEIAGAVNAEAPRVMARACAEKKIPLIHFSTDYVFDGESLRPYIENDSPNPLNVYGATKLAGESAIRASGATHAILRLSWVFSAHGANFVKSMLRMGRERGAVRVVDDQRGRPTAASHAADVAIGVARALIEDASRTGVYHFAGAEAVTWAGFAERIFKDARLPVDVARIPTTAYPTPARRPRYSVLDTTKFTKTFGVAAPSWRDGLVEVLNELGASPQEQGPL